jgi:hypothetical protein
MAMGAERARRRGASSSPWRGSEEEGFLLRLVLGLAAGLRGPLVALGVDYPRFRELLRARVVLTQRAGGESAGPWAAAGAALALMMTWFAGLGLGLVALLTEDGGLWTLVSLALLMLMLAVLLLQVLVGILVDPTDIGVVAPHPVTDRTVFAVRLAEVAAYVLVVVATFVAGAVLLPLFALPPLVVLALYPLLALLAGVVTLGLVTLLFALCLRVVGPTHFQRVSLWLQVGAGAGLFVVLYGSRIVPREQWALWIEEHGWLSALLPPFQYAELFAWACGTRAGFPRTEALGALLLPPAALALTFWLASRYFVAGLQGTLGAPVRRAGWERGLLARLGARLASREERAGFDFALALSRREPHLLRAVLPQLVMFQAMAIGSGFGLRRDLAFFIPFSAAFILLVLPNLLLQAQSTSAPEARVLFVTTPLADEDAFLRGSVKALLAQWLGIPALAVVGIQLWAVGPGGVPRIALAFALVLVAALFFTRVFQLGIPFTRSIRVGETGAANLGIVLLMGLALGGVGLAHFVLCLHPAGVWGGLAACAGLAWVLWRRLGGLRVAADRRLLVPRSRLVVEER